MTTNAEENPTVFISYSHKDEEWKDLLRPHLKMLEQAGRIRIWDDRDIDAGAQWYNDIKQAMGSAAVAVCLISADFLASDFCVKEEIPYLLERRERDGMLLLPVLVRPCVWKVAPWLEKTQMLPRDGKSVTGDFKGNEDEVFALVAETIFDKLDNPNYQPPKPPPPRWSPPEHIAISRLPVTGAELFGRQKELEMLDEAWASEETNVVSLVAWGGVGKSTLVNKWLERMQGDNYRGARRVYAWSFYSQGTGERVTSADLFINNALQWFGDTDPTAGSPWDKGERLARLVQTEKTLLVLDGLEPLQSPHAHERGKIKDPALVTLLTELARHNPGLCLITTRERVSNLVEFQATALHKDLEQISDEAGRALLRVGGVQGTDAELEQATRDFGNHALAINLLAVYLRDLTGHHISHAAEIPDLDIPEDEGKHPRRLMVAFALRFGDGPEVELLHILGLFDRPADSKSLEALRSSPPIPGLTDHISGLSEADWLRLIEKLRRARLIAPAGHHEDNNLDAHPLVREHFGQQIKHDHPDAWREGNDRLYEHLKNTTKELPVTIEEMMPLYAAVAHGCEAGKHVEVLTEVYVGRVLRGEDFFSSKELGAYGADLAALANFFDPPWRQPIVGLSEGEVGFILGQVGSSLRALGLLVEAAQLTKASLDIRISQNSWKAAAIEAGNVSGIYLTIGNLSQALAYAEQSIVLANTSENGFQRMYMRAILANVLHQMGRASEAHASFIEAETIHRELFRELPLVSVWGAYYCDFLLDQGHYPEVEARANLALKVATATNNLLSIALDYLSLGRAYLFQAQQEASDNYSLATDYLKRAVDGFRQAGVMEFLLRGLLARAELHTIKGNLSRAQDDLDETISTATRSSMGLHQADCFLGYARLYIAEGERQKAKESWIKAKEMIERMGYGRRKKDVEEIGRELGEVGGE